MDGLIARGLRSELFGDSLTAPGGRPNRKATSAGVVGRTEKALPCRPPPAVFSGASAPAARPPRRVLQPGLRHFLL